MQEGVISLLLAPIGFESNQHYELKRAEYSHKGNTKPVERDWSAEKKRTNLSVPNELGKAFLLARKHAAAELEQPKTIFAEGSG